MRHSKSVVRSDQRGNIPEPRVFEDTDAWHEELAAIDGELRRVLKKWGPQALTLFDWVSILGEEFGETCKAVNDVEYGSEGESDLDFVYGEAIQVAAVAVHLAAVIRNSRK